MATAEQGRLFPEQQQPKANYDGTSQTRVEPSMQPPSPAAAAAAAAVQRSRISIDEAIESLGHGRFQHRILWAAGLCFAADSMEVLLLSFLSVVLDHEWELSAVQTSAITSSVFVGALLGTLLLGCAGDRYGRKPVFIATAAIICVFGFLTAIVKEFIGLLVCRFLVGFGVGGLTVPFDTLAEFVGTEQRGTNLLAIEYFWTAGTLLVPILAYFTLGDDEDWRLFVALCAIPCLLSTLLAVLVVPESPRWLLSQGRSEEAMEILRHAAAINRLDAFEIFPKHMQLMAEDVIKEGTFADLLSPAWRKTTLCLWGTWAGFAFLYYGTIISVTLVFADTNEEAYSFDYGAIFASASAEIAGTTLVIWLIDRVGRIPSQAASYFFGGISVFALCILASLSSSLRWELILCSFLARMFFMSASCTSWVSTAEIMTTELRTTGHSAANAVARLSGAVTPFIISSDTSFTTIGVISLLVGAATATCAAHLPETKGRRMGVAMDDDESNPNAPTTELANHFEHSSIMLHPLQ